MDNMMIVRAQSTRVGMRNNSGKLVSPMCVRLRDQPRLSWIWRAAVVAFHLIVEDAILAVLGASTSDIWQRLALHARGSLDAVLKLLWMPVLCPQRRTVARLVADRFLCCEVGCEGCLADVLTGIGV